VCIPLRQLRLSQASQLQRIWGLAPIGKVPHQIRESRAMAPM
jgi:hypothetical protein